MSVSIRIPVVDPDLQIKKGAGGWGRAARQKKTKSFRPLGPHFGLEVTREGPGPPGPLPWIRQWVHKCISGIVAEWSERSGLVIRRVSVNCGVGVGARAGVYLVLKNDGLTVRVRVRVDTNLTLTLT